MSFSLSDREAAKAWGWVAFSNPADLALLVGYLKIVSIVEQLGKTPVPISQAGILSGTS